VDGGLWVFGYGSLIWNPEFPVAERVIARADGWRRSFCMRSIHHRGTVEVPGLVLALDSDPGAACHGVALRAEPGTEEATLAHLRARELISSAYVETAFPVALADGRRVRAVAFVIDRAHAQYCGGLPLEDQARIIATATGGRGPNREYLWATAAHLAELGLPDPELDWLAARVRALCGAA
jgi:cation transport protein ChaC